jgi:hypothetical protein
MPSIDIGVCRIDVPSAGALLKLCTAIWPPAPTRFSTTTLLP